MTADDRKAALDRLIDQELLREQQPAADSPHASPEEVAQRVAEIRKQYPEAETELGWQALLDRYRLSEETLKNQVAVELDLMRLVDARLRPSVTVDSKSIESYYKQELLPQLRQSGRAERSPGGSHGEDQGTSHPEENQPTADRLAAKPAGGKPDPRRGADARLRRPQPMSETGAKPARRTDLEVSAVADAGGRGGAGWAWVGTALRSPSGRWCASV